MLLVWNGRRLQVRELGMSILDGRFGQAADIVHNDPSVLYQIEEHCLSYPIHLASACGETNLAEHMYTVASLDGIGKLHKSETEFKLKPSVHFRDVIHSATY